MTAHRHRRSLLAALALPAVPRIARAQGAKLPKVGALIAGPRVTDASTRSTAGLLKRRMEELGWIEGRTVAYEFRYAEGRIERLSELARELVQQDVTLILAMGPAPTAAAREATRAIPLVMGNVDPVEQGLIASFARPGGNITGWSFVSAEVTAKQIELLKEALPKLARLGVLSNPASPGFTSSMPQIVDVARSQGLTLHSYEARRTEDVEGTFAAMARDRIEALIVRAEPVVIDTAREQIVAACERQRIPAVYLFRNYVDAGGLMSYGPSLPAMMLRFAYYADRILRGAKPADLPVERPDKYELVVNPKAAQAIGFTIPPRLLAFADDVIR